jgi:hypothetical protein
MWDLQLPQLVPIDLRSIPSDIVPLTLKVSGQPREGIEMTVSGKIGEKYFHLFFRQTITPAAKRKPLDVPTVTTPA